MPLAELGGLLCTHGTAPGSPSSQVVLSAPVIIKRRLLWLRNASLVSHLTGVCSYSLYSSIGRHTRKLSAQT